MKERTSPFTNVIQFPTECHYPGRCYCHKCFEPWLAGLLPVDSTKRLAYAAHFGITPETATPSQRAYYGI